MPTLHQQLSTFTAEISRLRGLWAPRNRKIQEWYKILLMEDKLAQEGMESFTSNNPRTAFNLALHLLSPRNIPIRIPPDPLDRITLAASGEVERGLQVMHSMVEQQHRKRGRKGWLRELASFLLATGWYAVFTMIDESTDDQECVAEVWNPVDVYPEYDDYVGLMQVVHSYTMSKPAFLKKARQSQWSIPRALGAIVRVDNLWYYDDSGQVLNTILADGGFVKPPQLAPEFLSIPILVSPAGGLPDRGSILTDQSWLEHVGEAMVATNEYVLHSYNKQMTFLQQLLRDAAQPVSLERNMGTHIVSNPQDLYKRGAHFRAGPGEDLTYLQKPPIPLEARTVLFDMDAMLQRGSLPHVMFGNIQQQLTGYLLAQVSASAQQILSPYAYAEQGVLSDIFNAWIDQIHRRKLRPYGISLPKLPKGVEVHIELKVQIPGDLMQRTTVAKMLNPQFVMSNTLVTDLLFPEISDPMKEESRIQAEMALRHPISIIISLIRAFRDQAQVLLKQGDQVAASHYLIAAQRLAQELEQPQPEQPGPGQQAPGPGQPGPGGQQPVGTQPGTRPTSPRPASPRQEVMPRESLEAQRGGEFPLE